MYLICQRRFDQCDWFWSGLVPFRIGNFKHVFCIGASFCWPGKFEARRGLRREPKIRSGSYWHIAESGGGPHALQDAGASHLSHERTQRQQRTQRTQRITMRRSRASCWAMNVKNVQEAGARSSKLGFPNLPQMVWLARSRSLGPRGPLASPRSLSPPPRRLKSLCRRMRSRAKRGDGRRPLSSDFGLRCASTRRVGGARWPMADGIWQIGKVATGGLGIYESYDNSTNLHFVIFATEAQRHRGRQKEGGISASFANFHRKKSSRLQSGTNWDKMSLTTIPVSMTKCHISSRVDVRNEPKLRAF